MSEKAIRDITFSGKKNDWRQWSKNFSAVAEKRENLAILEKDQMERGIMIWTVRMKMRKLSLPRHSRAGAANVENLVTR